MSEYYRATCIICGSRFTAETGCAETCGQACDKIYDEQFAGGENASYPLATPLVEPGYPVAGTVATHRTTSPAKHLPPGGSGLTIFPLRHSCQAPCSHRQAGDDLTNKTKGIVNE